MEASAHCAFDDEEHFLDRRRLGQPAQDVGRLDERDAVELRRQAEALRTGATDRL
jgi:hypothetical protein